MSRWFSSMLVWSTALGTRTYSVCFLRSCCEPVFRTWLIALNNGRKCSAASKCMHVNKSCKKLLSFQTNKCTCSRIIEIKSADNTRLGFAARSRKHVMIQCTTAVLWPPHIAAASGPSATLFIAHRKCLKLSCNMSCVKCGVWRVQWWSVIFGAQSVAWYCVATWSCAGDALGQQQRNRFARSARTRAWIAHGACKF